LITAHDHEGNSEHLASVESPVPSVQKTQIYSPTYSKSSISAHKANTLNIQFMFCKEVFHKLKHKFCCGGCFQFFTEKDVIHYGTIMDIPHLCHKLTANLERDAECTSFHM